MTALRLGTRGSALALWQARTVAALLATTGAAVEIVTITTSGDRLQQAPLGAAGGKRLFVKEIEDALLREEIDLAVHSAKDMPAVAPEGLDIAGVLPREDPRDAIVLPVGVDITGLPHVLAILDGAPAIGTGSVRRIAQLAALLPQAIFAPIRGNVDTRLRKLDAGGFNALILAAAGLIRLGFGARISVAVPIEQCIPAPGQGIVAIETRAGDGPARRAVEAISDPRAAVSLRAERAVVASLGGGCQLPLGAIALHDSGGLGTLDLHGVVASTDGRRIVRRRIAGLSSEPEASGQRLADAIAAAGGVEILDEIRRASVAE